MIVMAATASAAWITLGWPVPATTSYVVQEVKPAFERIAGLEQKHNSLTVIVLRQKQSFLIEEIQGLEAERLMGGDSRHLDSLIRVKKGEVRAIERKIDSIEAGE